MKYDLVGEIKKILETQAQNESELQGKAPLTLKEEILIDEFNDSHWISGLKANGEDFNVVLNSRDNQKYYFKHHDNSIEIEGELFEAKLYSDELGCDHRDFRYPIGNDLVIVKATRKENDNSLELNFEIYTDVIDDNKLVEGLDNLKPDYTTFLDLEYKGTQKKAENLSSELNEYAGYQIKNSNNIIFMPASYTFCDGVKYISNQVYQQYINTIDNDLEEPHKSM